MTPTFEEVMQTPAPEPVLCDSCEEPLTIDRPGSNWWCHSTEASIFPYNGGRFSVVLHDNDEPYDCVMQWFEDSPDLRGEVDSPVVVP